MLSTIDGTSQLFLDVLGVRILGVCLYIEVRKDGGLVT